MSKGKPKRGKQYSRRRLAAMNDKELREHRSFLLRKFRTAWVYWSCFSNKVQPR